MKRFLIVLFLLVIIISGIAYGLFTRKTFIKPSPPKNQTTLGVSTDQPLDHIVIITMENKTYADIVGNTSSPYINSLIKAYSFADNYSAITHPSLPNYLALIGGSTFGVTSDCEDCFISAPNLIDQLEKAGKTWKAYMESMPDSCFVGSSYPYAQKHNPFIYFDNIRTNATRCQKIVPYTELSHDLQNNSTTPNFIWISPNLCHDMHDCSVATGDTWLSQEVPQILSSDAFTHHHSLLVITWDEAEGEGPNQVPAIFIGDSVRKDFVSHKLYSHYSLLRTVEDVWQLSSLTHNTSDSTPIRDIFQ